MIQRQPYLPRFMAGGPGNPLGARALYLGATVYRIHGTNQPQDDRKRGLLGLLPPRQRRRRRPVRPRSGRNQGRGPAAAGNLIRPHLASSPISMIRFSRRGPMLKNFMAEISCRHRLRDLACSDTCTHRHDSAGANAAAIKDTRPAAVRRQHRIDRILDRRRARAAGAASTSISAGRWPQRSSTTPAR